MSLNAPLIIGLDGGGSHCRATLFDATGTPINHAVSGSANVARDFPAATHSIVHAVTDVLAKSGLNDPKAIKQSKVFAGLAGAHVESARLHLDNWKHPFHHFSAVTDLHAASVGAHNGQNGATLIVGTGSSAAAYAEGKLIQFGGHGFQLGDKGSGAWIGLQAIKRTLMSHDGVADSVGSTFTLPLLNFLELKSTSEIVSLTINRSPAYFAKLAPLVVSLAEAGEKTAVAIIHEGATYLSSIAMQAVTHSRGSLCLIGGLSQSLKPWLDNQVQAKIVEAIHEPEWGAVLAGRCSAQALIPS